MVFSLRMLVSLKVLLTRYICGFDICVYAQYVHIKFYRYGNQIFF